MADPQRIDIPGVGVVEFPDSMSAEDVNAAAKRLHDEANPSAKSTPSSSDALGTAALPLAQRGAEQLATHPNVPRALAKVGRVIGGMAPIAGGIAAGGPAGGAMGLAAASKGAWAGGKTGWFSGKLAQNVAAPVATALGRLAPVTHALSGVQGVGDLAQMAEPDRQDIGFMGVGRSTPHDADHPAMLNALYEAIRARLRGGK